MIIIPARLGSTRFPNKILADIMGLPMVIRTALAVADIDSVVIATDSKEVIDIASEHDIKAILTSSSCQSGTDRIYEAAKKLKLPLDEIIINVQADEPFIEQSVVLSVYELTKKYAKDERVVACSAFKYISAPEAMDPNIVKVVTDNEGLALYFSRSQIPYPRDHQFDHYKGHLGIYGFTMKSLTKFCSFDTSTLENIEKLEQLRILANGYRVAMVEVETESFGIDTLQDLQKALKRHSL